MTSVAYAKQLTPAQELQTHGIPSMEVFSQLVDVPITVLTQWRTTRKRAYQALLFSASIWHVN